MRIDLNVNAFTSSSPIVREQCEDGLLITFPCQGGSLSLCGPFPPWSAIHPGYLVLEVTALEDFDLALRMNFLSGGEPSVCIRMGLLPHMRVPLSIPLSALDSHTQFLPRIPGRLKAMVMGSGLSWAQVREMTLTTAECFSNQRLVLHALYLTDQQPDMAVTSAPIVDRLGQYKKKQWPGKTAGEAQMVARLRSEAAQAPVLSAGLSRFGGDLSVRWEAAGFFRTRFDGRRWYLADPDGYRFLSTGMDCCIPGEKGPIAGLDCLYDELPDPSAFAPAYLLPGSDGDGPERGVSFATANLIRAFGAGWKRQWTDLTLNRLKRWGFNTIGNWSDPELLDRQAMPYVWQPPVFPTTPIMIFRDFPDVFSEAYQADSRRCARHLAPRSSDPYMIGYFLRNEPQWSFDQQPLAQRLLESLEYSDTKRALIQWLQYTYQQIDALNRSWGSSYASFESLLQPRDPFRPLSPGEQADLMAFSGRMIERYIAIPSEEYRKADPNHLNLGVRYPMLTDPVLLSGAESVDIFSINCYYEDSYDMVQMAGERIHKPVMVGEFHAGAVDAGMLSAGICSVRTQRDRGLAYRAYYERSLQSPYFIGAHYFQLNDQPLLGRRDGENMQIGCVDVCQRPYEVFIGAAAALHRDLYRLSAGAAPSHSARPQRIPRLMGF